MIGNQFDRFQIKGELGQGGLSTVYLAYDPQMQIDVALKVLNSNQIQNSQLRNTFKREVEIEKLLRNSAIVLIHNHGEFNSQPYIVMEYMQGGSLVDLLMKRRLSLNEITSIIQRICNALNAAHTRGIIHRDVKPGNILFDNAGAAHLSDFGVARLTRGTQTVSNFFTPKYMAPEQAPPGRSLNAQTDIYQVGVVLFEMLTGVVPFDADDDLTILHKHVNEPIPKLTNIDPNIPSAYQAIIEKAMAKKPEDRFVKISELADAVRVILKDIELSSTIGEQSKLIVGDTDTSPTIKVQAPPTELAPTIEVPAPPTEPAQRPSIPKIRRTIPIRLITTFVVATFLLGMFIFITRLNFSQEQSVTPIAANPSLTPSIWPQSNPIQANISTQTLAPTSENQTVTNPIATSVSAVPTKPAIPTSQTVPPMEQSPTLILRPTPVPDQPTSTPIPGYDGTWVGTNSLEGLFEITVVRKSISSVHYKVPREPSYEGDCSKGERWTLTEWTRNQLPIEISETGSFVGGNIRTAEFNRLLVNFSGKLDLDGSGSGQFREEIAISTSCTAVFSFEWNIKRQ